MTTENICKNCEHSNEKHWEIGCNVRVRDRNKTPHGLDEECFCPCKKFEAK